SLFEAPEENLPLREAIEFYKHAHGWTNRLIAGDSLLVMNSLLEKEGMAGKVQVVYFDPPYGIKYGSNFQPFVNKRDVSEGRDEDLTQEPEMIQAFRDTWELGVHSYLTYLRDRLLTARELLHPSGSCFVQISDENVHRVRELMDEVLGARNFVSEIVVQKTGGLGASGLKRVADYLLWYARDGRQLKYRQLHLEKVPGVGEGTGERYDLVESPAGDSRPLTPGEREAPGSITEGWRLYQLTSLMSGAFRENTTVPFKFDGETYHPGANACWKTTVEGLSRLVAAGRIKKAGRTIRYVRYLDDFPAYEITNVWGDVAGAPAKVYVVQTSPSVLQRCILMATDPGDLVFDPTCGSGTTAVVAEQWGRRWITCDTSRVAVALAKQRLMTSVFDFYELARPEEGVSSGFRYRTVPHVTLKSIANNPDIREGMKRVDIDEAIRRHADQETLYDQPFVDKSKARVTGPFTVEAVPAPAVRAVGDIREDAVMDRAPEVAVARIGSTLRQSEWTGELLKCGIRAKGGQHIHFSRVEPLPGARWLHADAETKEAKPKRVVVSFGPEHAPLEQRQVGLALEEAQALLPKPDIVAFASFHFDPEAAKDIDETKWPGVTLLKVQMNTDLLTEDLKKKRASNESFWMIGQPDVEVRKAKGEKGKWQVEVRGFDYYDPRTGTIVSGDTTKIAIWMLDTDYDGRSLYPRQVFFPMAGEKDGWARLAKNLKAEIDEDLIENYRGSVSLPFAAGENRRAAVKIVDDRGIESLRIVRLE
ncbi:MAG TPA: site-specific DNA-methyltransferase, partial [Candidatus Eisenbacteria bacterium]|nr:site-specific DNA-methyltransferase [Candidatus Eisenbacteria bacterium]